MSNLTKFVLTFSVAATLGCGVIILVQRYSNTSRNPEISQDQRKCLVDGESFYQTYYLDVEKQYSTSLENYAWSSPQYHYNQQMNTCLVYIGYDWTEGTARHNYNYIFDIYAHKEIAISIFTQNTNDPLKIRAVSEIDGIRNLSSAEFESQKTKLFSE